MKNQNNKRSIQISNFPGVSYTALMTIYCRAMDYLSPHSILKDENAYDLFQRIEADWKRIKRGLYNHDFKLTSIRGRKFDIMCRDFLSTHPNSIVVSLGSGLDYRFGRIDNGQFILVDIDLPEVISLQKTLHTPSDRNIMLSQSVLDFSWIDEVRKVANSGKRKVFFIAEGLIPYLDKSEITEMFQMITRNFSGAEIFFDVIGAKSLKLMESHSGIKEWNATLKSGFNSGMEVENLNAGFKLISEWYYPEDPDARKGLMMKLMWLVPLFRSMLFFIHGRFEKD